jgi:crotonobetainyl-CoA:carnitine CoA-transferase CaiB-like acyl-CoA transferase
VLDGLIAETLRGDGADAWLARLEAVGVPCGRINTVSQALEDPHTAARRMVETVAHLTVGTLPLLGIPFKLHDSPATVRRPPRRSCARSWA